MSKCSVESWTVREYNDEKGYYGVKRFSNYLKITTFILKKESFILIVLYNKYHFN